MKRLVLGSLLSCMLVGQCFGSESIYSKYYQEFMANRISSEGLSENIWNDMLRAKLRRRYVVGGASGAAVGLGVAMARRYNRGESIKLEPKDALWSLGGFVLGSRIGGMYDIVKKIHVDSPEHTSNLLGGFKTGAFLGAATAGALHMLCGGGASEKGGLSLAIGAIIGSVWGCANKTISGDRLTEAPHDIGVRQRNTCKEERRNDDSRFNSIYWKTRDNYLSFANTDDGVLLPEKMLFASVPKCFCGRRVHEA